jgi:hypothetical protein
MPLPQGLPNQFYIDPLTAVKPRRSQPHPTGAARLWPRRSARAPPASRVDPVHFDKKFLSGWGLRTIAFYALLETHFPKKKKHKSANYGKTGCTTYILVPDHYV